MSVHNPAQTPTVWWTFWGCVGVFVLLIAHSPHQLDLAIAQAAWDYYGGQWAAGVMPTIYKLQKLVPFIAALIIVVLTARYWRGHNRAAIIACSLFLLAEALGTLPPAQLRSFSGVACPWSVEAFRAAGAMMVDPFSWLWNGLPKQGACWPSGHASAGFALVGLFFLAQRLWPRAAGPILGVVLLYGVVCTFTRIAQGAHFFSHGIATFTIDWVVACLVFAGPRFFVHLPWSAKKLNAP